MTIKDQLAPTPKIEANAPESPCVTELDKKFTPIYVALLDRLESNDSWRTIAKELLQTDPDKAPVEAHARFESYKKRALWMRDEGYKQLMGERTPQDLFRAWATEILMTMVSMGEIFCESAQPANVWAAQTIDRLIDEGSLQLDPKMNDKQCARLLQKLLTTRH